MDLLYLTYLTWLGYKPDNLRNLGRVLVGFKGTLIDSLREIMFPISISPVTALVLLIVVDEPIKLQRHTRSHLDPRDEGIAIFLSSEIELLNPIGTGGHLWRLTGSSGLLCT